MTSMLASDCLCAAAAHKAKHKDSKPTTSQTGTMLSRRDFFRRLAITAASFYAWGIGVFAEPGQSLSGGESTCRSCGATVICLNTYSRGPKAGLYCPNCGIEFNRLCYDLDSEHSFQGASEYVKRESVSGRPWKYAQIPFPNRNLVSQSPKATILMSDIRF
jgi:hypothetical protein